MVNGANIMIISRFSLRPAHVPFSMHNAFIIAVLSPVSARRAIEFVEQPPYFFVCAAIKLSLSYWLICNWFSIYSALQCASQGTHLLCSFSAIVKCCRFLRACVCFVLGLFLLNKERHNSLLIHFAPRRRLRPFCCLPLHLWLLKVSGTTEHPLYCTHICYIYDPKSA